MKIDCRKCEHFFITWETGKPYGCKGFGFKSGRIPSIEVLESSGRECLKFTPVKQKIRLPDKK
jgi:hypothetical protein